MRNIRLMVVCTAVFALVFAASCGDDGGGGPNTETDCTDGQDNDQDGYTDCDDSDCSAHSSCTVDCNNNNLCEPGLGENAANCADCQTDPVCGNGTCEAGENETNCPQDCSTDPVCGNGTCEAGENETNCPQDCSDVDQCTTTTDLIEQNGCPGQSCTLLDQAGTIGCSPSGTNANYADCSNQQGCLPGAMCAGSGGALYCLPFCDLDDPSFVCPGGGICMAQISTSDGNVGLCAEGDACDPFAMTGCDPGDGCYFLSEGNTVCTPAGTGAIGSTCQYVDDCSPGLACMGSPGVCAELCDAAFNCTTGTCQGIGTIPNWPDIGVCQ